MAISIIFRADAQRSIAFGSISGTYASIGSPLDRQSRIYEMWNLTDATLQFSYDGVNDHFVLPAGAGKVLDIGSNQQQTAGYWMSIGSQFSVKTLGTPTTGSVYLSVYHGKGE